MDKGELLTNTKVIIVGSGRWANILQTVLEQNAPEYVIQRVGAREFINRNTFPIFENDIYWVATRPDLQIEIVALLSMKNVRIILEKPLISNVSQLKELIGIMKVSTSRIAISQPWIYSDLWKNFTESFQGISKIVSIRKSTQARTYISPFLDWSPHDFSLFVNLGISPLDLTVRERKLKNSHEEIWCEDSKSDISINLHYGVDLVQKNEWNLENVAGFSGQINFSTREYRIFDEKRREVRNYSQRRDHHPLVELLRQVDWEDKRLIQKNLLFYGKFFGVSSTLNVSEMLRNE